MADLDLVTEEQISALVAEIATQLGGIVVGPAGDSPISFSETEPDPAPGATVFWIQPRAGKYSLKLVSKGAL